VATISAAQPSRRYVVDIGVDAVCADRRGAAPAPGFAKVDPNLASGPNSSAPPLPA